MGKTEKAKEFMAERKSNCAQSVLRVFAESLELDEDIALSIAQGFGGGMHIDGTCGAVTGAYMALGLAYKTSKDNPRSMMEIVNALQSEFNRWFLNKHGSLSCSGLLGYNLADPIQLTKAREAGLFTSKCPVFVGDATAIVEELLKK